MWFKRCEFPDPEYCDMLPLKERTDTRPSDEAQAKSGPSSCGAQATEFTMCAGNKDRGCLSTLIQTSQKSLPIVLVVIRPYPDAC